MVGASSNWETCAEHPVGSACPSAQLSLRGPGSCAGSGHGKGHGGQGEEQRKPRRERRLQLELPWEALLWGTLRTRFRDEFLRRFQVVQTSASALVLPLDKQGFGEEE